MLSPAQSNEIYDVVIVGAGMAGLAAAAWLEAQGFSVVVLEAQSRVGGRVRSGLTPAGRRYEAGGQFVSSKMVAVRQLLQECNLNEVLSAVGEETILQGAENTQFGAAPALDQALLFHGEVQDESWSVEDFIAATFADPVMRTTARTLLTEYLCADPADVNALSAYDYFMRDTAKDQTRQADGSLDAIAGRLAARLSSMPRLNWPVRKVRRDGEFVQVFGDAETMKARAAIVALPMSRAASLVAAEEFDSSEYRALSSFVPGAVVKISHFVKHTKPKEKLSVREAITTREPSMFAVDATREGASEREIIVFVAGSSAHAMARMGDAERLAITWKFVQDAFDLEDDLLESVATVWVDDPWVGGGYASQVRQDGVPLARAVITGITGNIAFATSDIADRFAGHIEGAIRSGELAARQIAQHLEILCADIPPS